MRIAVLWPRMSGYIDACLRATVGLGHDVYVAHHRANEEAPYDDDQFDWIEHRYRYSGSPDADRLRRDLASFRPDVIVAVSWHVPQFRQVLREWRGRALRVLFMDNPWRGTLKQWGGRAVAPALVRPFFDTTFLPGVRQAQFARMLGFADDEIWTGCYVCDHGAFDRGPRLAPPKDRAFLVCARLTADKGIADLADAWAEVVADGSVEGWRLRVAGVGPLAHRLERLERVDMLGFVQPAELPHQYHAASAFVLPSRVEHWGVVVHEACAAGLPVVTTTEVGAAPHLLRDGINGWTVPPGRPDLLAGRLRDAAALDLEGWREMSERSRALASSYTPEGWARYLVAQCRRAGVRDGQGVRARRAPGAGAEPPASALAGPGPAGGAASQA